MGLEGEGRSTWTPRAGAAARPRAVALRYDPGLPAPFIAAKAEGRLALRLLAIAEEAGVPILRDGALAEALYPAELGAFLPEAFYEVLAKVFISIKNIEAT